MLEDLVEVGHGGVVVLGLIVHQRPVEVREGVLRVELQCLVHVRDALLEISLRRIHAPAADVSLGLEAVQLDGLVVVLERRESVAQEEVAGAPVQIGGRILALLADVAVEVVDSFVEALGEEVGHAAAEVEAADARAEDYRPPEVLQSLFVIALAAFRNGPVVVAVGEHGVDAHAPVEVLLRAADVAEVVLGDAPVEEAPVVGGVKLGEDVEVLYGKGVFPVAEGGAPAPHEHVLVPLGTHLKAGGKQDRQQDCDSPYCLQRLFH